MPGSSLSWSSVAEFRSTKPDLGALEAADFDCDAVELVVACVLVMATDMVKMQAKTNRNARADGFLGMVNKSAAVHILVAGVGVDGTRAFHGFG